MRFPKVALVVRGQGYQDGGADVRDFRRAVLTDLVRPEESLLQTAAMGEARVTTDPAGNSKLSKGSEGWRRQRARDDAAPATLLARPEGYREWHATLRPVVDDCTCYAHTPTGESRADDRRESRDYIEHDCGLHGGRR